MKQYDPTSDWFLADVRPGVGVFTHTYVFQSREVREASRCVREVYADTTGEAWAQLTPPQW